MPSTLRGQVQFGGDDAVATWLALRLELGAELLVCWP